MSGVDPPSLPMGVGTDIERVNRFRGESRAKRQLLRRVFTIRERRYCESKADPAQHFAGTFAAKEASCKAVQRLTKSKVSMLNFEVSHDQVGAPNVTYVGTDAQIKRVVVEASVSHTSDNAVAVAIAMEIQ